MPIPTTYESLTMASRYRRTELFHPLYFVPIVWTRKTFFLQLLCLLLKNHNFLWMPLCLVWSTIMWWFFSLTILWTLLTTMVECLVGGVVRWWDGSGLTRSCRCTLLLCYGWCLFVFRTHLITTWNPSGFYRVSDGDFTWYSRCWQIPNGSNFNIKRWLHHHRHRRNHTCIKPSTSFTPTNFNLFYTRLYSQ